MPINTGVVASSGTPGPVFIFDPVNVAGGSPDASATMTTVTVGGVVTTVNAALEIQSTTGGFLLPRMTTAQRDAMTTAGIVNGFLIYNSTLLAVQARENGAWVTLSNAGGGTFVAGLGTEALPSYTFTGETNTGMWSSGPNTIDFSGNAKRQLEIVGTAAAVNYLKIAGAATGNPVAIFTASGTDADVTLRLGAQQSGNIDFITGAEGAGRRQLRVSDTGLAVNYLTITGSAGTNPTSLFVTGTGADIGIVLKMKGDGSSAGASGIQLKGDTVSIPVLRFYNIANTFYTGIQSANPAANFVYALPLTPPVQYSAGENVPLTATTVGQMVFSDTSPRYAQFSVSSAAIKAMFGAPLNLIATPGAGLAIIIVSVAIEMEAGVQYANGGNVYLQYGAAAGSNFASSKFDPTLITSAASVLGFGTGPISSAAAGIIPTANLHNQGVYISNDGAAFITGTGTLEVSVLYYVLETA